MKRLLLIGVCWPWILHAQVVKPITTKAYQQRVQADSATRLAHIFKDTTNDIRRARLHVSYNTDLSAVISNIREGRNNKLVFSPYNKGSLQFGAKYRLYAGISNANARPSTQQEFVQGRNVGGSVSWRGPETNEVFSFGPSIHTLSYDGNPYAWDYNGRLVTEGGISPAKAYNNTILRTGTEMRHDLSFFLRLQKSYYKKLTVNFRLQQSGARSIIKGINNGSGQFGVTSSYQKEGLTINLQYTANTLHSNSSNRGGFLNRAYQYSLLSPISFDTRQGSLLNGMQRSYSNLADNPYFLLQESGNNNRETNQLLSLRAEQKIGHFRFFITQSLTRESNRQLEGFAPGTTGFLTGNLQTRHTLAKQYRGSLQTEIRTNFGGSHMRSETNIRFQYLQNSFAINRPFSHSYYRYTRPVREFFLSEFIGYSGHYLDISAEGSMKSYYSGTAGRQLLQPAATLSIAKRFTELNKYLWMRIRGNYSGYFNEPALSTSAAATQLQAFTIAQSAQYYPQQEFIGFNNLQPAQNREWNTGIEIRYGKHLEADFTWYDRRSTNTIFPLLNANGIPVLENLATIRNRGTEASINLDYRINPRYQYRLLHTISFTANRSCVLHINNNANHLPLYGFANVHTTLVEGKPLGVISGNTWARTANGEKQIGSDGFPVAGNSMEIIGDPNPDMTWKLSQSFTMRRWTFQLNWQYTIGGQTWNGTQAVLDYYGRSANSATERSITNYIFSGVRADGSHNQQPVAFYNPALPLEQNRWVRYGAAGVAEDYLEKADCIRLNDCTISFRPKPFRKTQDLTLNLYITNLLVWKAGSGVDPQQTLFDQPGAAGLDFFNLPAVRSIGASVAIQF